MNQDKEFMRIAQGWTQNALARTSDGTVVTPNDPRAVKWCPVGALRKVGGLDADPVICRLGKLLQVSAVTTWNNAAKRTQRQVFDAMKDAMEAM